MLDEDFFMNNPPGALKAQMRKVVKDYLGQIEKDGYIISDVKEKKNHLSKMAQILKERKIGGWVDLKDFHLNSTIYKMYKSLVDMVNTEMKGKKPTSE